MSRLKLPEIRQRLKVVEKLLDDLKPHVSPQTTWSAEISAPRSLGDKKVTVELWFLAGYFLVAWHDWHLFLRRYERYANNEGQDALLQKCKRIDNDCLRLVDYLKEVKDIDEPLSRVWKEDLLLVDLGSTMLERGSEVRIEDAIRRAVHAVIQHHRCWQLMNFLRNGASPALDRCWQLVHLFNETRYPDVRTLDDLLDGKIRYHLRQYRRAELLYSWLDDLWDQPSVLIRLLSEEIMIPYDLPYHFLEGLEGRVRETVRLVIKRVTEAITEMGFDDYIDEIVSDESPRGPNLLQGVGAINMIPSNMLGPCHEVLLAISKGNKGPLGFTEIMRQVREHLIKCPQTKGVVILCDFWTQAALNEHIRDLQAHYKRGVRFLFLLVGIDRRSLAVMPGNFGP